MTVIIKGLEYTKEVTHNAIAHHLPTGAQLVPLLGNNCKHPCVINILLILNPKHNTIPATRKKINSVPAEARTQLV